MGHWIPDLDSKVKDLDLDLDLWREDLDLDLDSDCEDLTTSLGYGHGVEADPHKQLTSQILYCNWWRKFDIYGAQAEKNGFSIFKLNSMLRMSGMQV